MTKKENPLPGLITAGAAVAAIVVAIVHARPDSFAADIADIRRSPVWWFGNFLGLTIWGWLFFWAMAKLAATMNTSLQRLCVVLSYTWGAFLLMVCAVLWTNHVLPLPLWRSVWLGSGLFYVPITLLYVVVAAGFWAYRGFQS
jgi:hypothetical protein